MTCDMLVLFQGKPILKREKANHVEYESPDYSAFFQAVLVIYQFGEVIAGALKTTRETELCDILHNYQLAIEYVLTFWSILRTGTFQVWLTKKWILNYPRRKRTMLNQSLEV